MRSESISLSYPWCKSFRNHYFHCYYFQSVAWYFLQNLLLCTVQASEFWKTTIEVMISYKTEMTTLISLIINVESRLLILKKESTLHVYWSLRFLPPSTPRLLHLCASFFLLAQIRVSQVFWEPTKNRASPRSALHEASYLEALPNFFFIWDMKSTFS